MENPNILLNLREDKFRVGVEIGQQLVVCRTFKVYRAVKDRVPIVTAASCLAVKFVDAENDSEAWQELLSLVWKQQDYLHMNLMPAESFTSTPIYVVQMAHMMGSLRSIMIELYPSGFPEEVVLLALRETLQGLSVLHELDVSHGELSAGRVFVRPYSDHSTDQARIQLSIGASAYDLHRTAEEIVNLFDLTFLWRWGRPPELYNITQENTKEGDIWLIGLMALELANGSLPFQNNCEMRHIVQRVRDEKNVNLYNLKHEQGSPHNKRKKKGQWFPSIFKRTTGVGESAGVATVPFSEDFVELVLDCLSVDAMRRPSVEELLGMKILQGLDDVEAIFERHNLDEALKRQNLNEDHVVEVDEPPPPPPQHAAHHSIIRSIGNSAIDEEALVYTARWGENEEPILIIKGLRTTNPLDYIESQVRSSKVIRNYVENILHHEEFFTDCDYFYIRMPQVKGSLYELMSKRYEDGVPQGIILLILQRVAVVISGCYRHSQHHENLCAAHVYLDEDGQVKVGSATTVFNFFDDQARIQDPYWKVTTLCDAASAPEARKDSCSDVWMLGIIALELIYHGIRVTDRQQFDGIIDQIHESLKLPRKFGEGVRKKEYSRKFVKFVVSCLRLQPDRRPHPRNIDGNSIFDNDAINYCDLSNFKWTQ